MIKEIYKKIFNKNHLIDLDIFIKEYHDFEEIPLVTRYSQLSSFESSVDKEDVQLFLINAAVFLQQNINVYASKVLSKVEFENFLTCITFADFDELESTGYCIPNILVTRKIGLFEFLTEYSNQITKETIASVFVRLGTRDTYGFFEALSKDDLCGDLVRLYAVDPINKAKLDRLNSNC